MLREKLSKTIAYQDELIVFFGQTSPDADKKEKAMNHLLKAV